MVFHIDFCAHSENYIQGKAMPSALVLSVFKVSDELKGRVFFHTHKYLATHAHTLLRII